VNPNPPTTRRLERADLPLLLAQLQASGYELIGPTLAAGAVVLGPIETVDQLPAGYSTEQQGGLYRLRQRTDAALFAHQVGPHSWKHWLHPPAVCLVTAQRTDQNQPWNVTNPPAAPRRRAFLGVRPCDLQAIRVLDKVFLEGPQRDPTYQAHRQELFLVVVNCTVPGGTCFCASLGTGPRATHGFDLALTEVVGAGQHHFIVEPGSTRGEELLASVPQRLASPAEQAQAAALLAQAAQQMGRHLDTTRIKELLYANYEHPRWNEVAERCLNCANCTMVCPTCFCANIEETTDLGGHHTARWRRWDSCFTLGFTRLSGGSVRSSSRARYRHWLVHKLATWHDQFGVSGCVGCGRCITWCPVAIDITEETAAIRATTGGAT
jgi:ferredoxin